MILSSVCVTMEMVVLIHLSSGLHPVAPPSVSSGSPRHCLPNHPNDSRHSPNKKKKKLPVSQPKIQNRNNRFHSTVERTPTTVKQELKMMS